MTIVPGFTDCHNHAGGTTLLYEVLVGNPFESSSLRLPASSKAQGEGARRPGTWVAGYFHDDTKLKDKRPLNRHDLDQVSTEHPVVVQHRGGHTSFYNTKALEMAKVAKDTPNPPGGTFDRDASGDLNGRVTDRAREVFNGVGQRPSFTPEQRAQRERDGIAHISKQFVRYGLTSVHHEGGDLAAIQDVRARGELRHRVSYEATGRVLDAMIANGIRSGFGDEWIKFGATAEHTVDGSFSERTMALSIPTQRQPAVQGQHHRDAGRSRRMGRTGAPRGHSGQLPRERRRCDRHVPHRVRARTESRSTPGCETEDHALHAHQRRPGAPDEGVRRRAGDVHHVRLLQHRQVPVLRRGADEAEHGVPYAARRGHSCRGGLRLQPGPVRGTHGDPGHGDAHRLGRDDVGREPARDGRRGHPDQHAQRRVRVARGAIKGSITSGKLADFVVLADDPHTVAKDKIKDIQIVRTVVGGSTMYEA